MWRCLGFRTFSAVEMGVGWDQESRCERDPLASGLRPLGAFGNGRWRS